MRVRRWSPERSFTTDYWLGDGALPAVDAWAGTADRVIVVTEPEVWRQHGPAIGQALSHRRLQTLFVAGECDKELASIGRLTTELTELRVHRHEPLLCVGGGACCDIGGFLAMVYMRGLDYALLPTTLMAQVDAAIGGKVGANHGARKNCLGGFYHPAVVSIVPRFLDSVPDREMRAGLAELVKLGIIRPDLGLFTLLRRLAEGDRSALPSLIERGVVGKLDLLAPDPFEKDLDRVLNLGHAVAHAAEKSDGVALLHGEAVAVGLAAVARFAAQAEICSAARASEILWLLQDLGLPTTCAVPHDTLRARLAEIADHRGGSLRLVVPSHDSVQILHEIDIDALVTCAISASEETPCA